MNTSNVDKAAGAARRGRLARIARSGWMTVHAVALCALAYIASVLLVNVSGILLHRLGLAWTGSVLVSSMLGFLIWLIILLWAFSSREALRNWMNVGGLTSAAWLLAWLLGGQA